MFGASANGAGSRQFADIGRDIFCTIGCHFSVTALATVDLTLVHELVDCRLSF
jgi:hypothetical protein